MITKKNGCMASLLEYIGAIIVLIVCFGCVIYLVQATVVDPAKAAMTLNNEKQNLIIDWCDEVEAATSADEYNNKVLNITHKELINCFLGSSDVKEGIIRVNDAFSEFTIIGGYADTENETYATKIEESKLEVVASIRYLKDLIKTHKGESME